MKILISITTVLLLVSLTSVGNGQDIFNGSGVNFDKTSWGSLNKKNNSQLFKNQQDEPVVKKNNWPKWNLFNKQNNNNGLGGMKPKFPNNFPKLFKKPGEMNLGAPFQNFHNNATQFWGKTTSGFSNWARETNAKMKERTFNTWDNITQGLSKPFSNAPKLKGPPLRSARSQSDQPRIRF